MKRRLVLFLLFTYYICVRRYGTIKTSQLKGNRRRGGESVHVFRSADASSYQLVQRSLICQYNLTRRMYNWNSSYAIKGSLLTTSAYGMYMISAEGRITALVQRYIWKVIRYIIIVALNWYSSIWPCWRNRR